MPCNSTDILKDILRGDVQDCIMLGPSQPLWEAELASLCT